MPITIGGEQYLTIGEAAEMVGIGRSKAYELVATGEWPAVHIGRSVRIPVIALEAWANLLTAEAIAESEQAEPGSTGRRDLL